jgi:hypothetical protein
MFEESYKKNKKNIKFQNLPRFFKSLMIHLDLAGAEKTHGK